MTDAQQPQRDPRGRRPTKRNFVKRRFYCASADGCLAWLAKDGTYKLVEFNFFGQANNICRRLQNILKKPHGVVTQDYALTEAEAEAEAEHLRACQRKSYHKLHRKDGE